MTDPIRKWYQSHKVVHGKMQCYDFFCPAISKPRISYMKGWGNWMLRYTCIYGAEKTEYAPLGSCLKVAYKVYGLRTKTQRILKPSSNLQVM